MNLYSNSPPLPNDDLGSWDDGNLIDRCPTAWWFAQPRDKAPPAVWRAATAAELAEIQKEMV